MYVTKINILVNCHFLVSYSQNDMTLTPCNSINTYMNHHELPELHSVFPKLLHVFPELHGVLPELHGWQMIYFWKYMVEDHVIPKLHTSSISVKHVSRITWPSAM